MSEMNIEITALPPRPSLNEIAVENDLTLVAVESDDSDYCMDRWFVNFKGNDAIKANGETMENAIQNFARNLQGKHLAFGEKVVIFPHDMAF